MNKTYTIIVEEDPETGDAILPFPPELLEEQDWREGDRLRFTIEDNTCIITNLCAEERKKSQS